MQTRTRWGIDVIPEIIIKAAYGDADEYGEREPEVYRIVNVKFKPAAIKLDSLYYRI